MHFSFLLRVTYKWHLAHICGFHTASSWKQLPINQQDFRKSLLLSVTKNTNWYFYGLNKNNGIFLNHISTGLFTIYLSIYLSTDEIINSPADQIYFDFNQFFPLYAIYCEKPQAGALGAAGGGSEKEKMMMKMQECSRSVSQKWSNICLLMSQIFR